ncbi:MAG: alpha/beta hydrolase [Moraxellaceae bacterium]|jgi:pimeloyl-ACP methyl ester carboxylesterase|nr:alpha/beta hydrolase [Moraxellaceae bacterium]
MFSPAHWRATPTSDYRGPRIGLVHGLAAGSHMERHLLTFLREAGFADTTLYSNYERPAVIARDMAEATTAGRAVALIGFSQGGFQVVKASHELDRLGRTVDLLVTLAAGGAGRFYFPQIGARPRRIPGNVRHCLNYFTEGDLLGTDLIAHANLAHADSPATRLENIAFPRDARTGHAGITRCFPPERVARQVRTQFLDRLLQELGSLQRA